MRTPAAPVGRCPRLRDRALGRDTPRHWHQTQIGIWRRSAGAPRRPASRVPSTGKPAATPARHATRLPARQSRSAAPPALRAPVIVQTRIRPTTASGNACALQRKSGALKSSRPLVTATSEYVARPVALPSTLRCCPSGIRRGDGHDPTATAAAIAPSVAAGMRRPAGRARPAGCCNDLDRAGAGRPHLQRPGRRGRTPVARRAMDREPRECRERYELFQGPTSRREPREVPVPHDARRDRLVGRPDQRPGACAAMCTSPSVALRTGMSTGSGAPLYRQIARCARAHLIGSQVEQDQPQLAARYADDLARLSRGCCRAVHRGLAPHRGIAGDSPGSALAQRHRTACNARHRAGRRGGRHESA